MSETCCGSIQTDLAWYKATDNTIKKKVGFLYKLLLHVYAFTP